MHCKLKSSFESPMFRSRKYWFLTYADRTKLSSSHSQPCFANKGCIQFKLYTILTSNYKPLTLRAINITSL